MNLFEISASLTVDTSKYENSIDDAKNDTNGMESELDDLSESLSDIEKDADDAGDALDSMAKIDALNTLADAAQSVVDKIIDIGSSAMETKDDIEESTSKAIAYLGLTGDAAETTSEVIQSVYENGWGDSLDEVADAVITVTENLGELDETSLEKITEQALALESTGVDMSESMRGINSLMEQFEITADEAMDLYVAGINTGLNKTDELGDNIAEYAGTFADAGYSAEEYFQLLQNGAENGAYNLDKVNDAINEATTRLEDGTIEESLDMFSDATAELFQAWQDGEATEKDVIESIVSDIANCTDEQTALNMAAEAFGTMGEDGSLKFITSLTAVGDTYSDVEGAADQFTETLSTDASTMAGNMRALQDAIAPLGEIYQSALTPVIGGLADIISAIMDVVSNAPALKAAIVAVTTAMIAFASAMAIKSTIQGVTTAMKALGIAMSANPITIIIVAIAALVAAFVYLWNNCEEFREFWTGLWDTIQELVSGAVDTITVIIEKLPQIFTDVWNSITTAVINEANKILQGVTSIFTSIKAQITSTINSIRTTVTTVFTAIQTTAITIFTTIQTSISTIVTSISTKISSVLTTIKTTFMNIFSGISSGVLSTLNTLASNVSAWGSSLVSSFTSIGKNLITGLWNGISSKVTWVVNKIKSMGSSITAAIKSVFGISSPSKVFAEIGGYLAEGLGEGWEDSYKDVESKITSGLNYEGSIGVETGSMESVLNLSISDAVTAAMSDQMDRVLSVMEEYFPQFGNQPIYLDGDTLVSATADRMDIALGKISKRKARLT